MNFDKLISKKNLILAWRRITSSSDARYKAFFRHILEAYELSFDKNIEDLRRRLANGEYIAQTPVRFYVPKPSGLQRPITLLPIEDQIVLQALANLFAEKVRRKRTKLAGKFIYSNKLGKKNSQFFLEKWQLGYSQLKRNLKLKFGAGYAWVATFDISAFYDTIPHDLLLNVLVGNKNNDLHINAKVWLKTWSSDRQSDQHSHGIPQGPMASDFLAECILLSIDEKMAEKYSYFRYVDDIRILGKTELEVRQALVYLDILCKSKGLIPNSDKTKIREFSSADEVVGDIPDVKGYFDDGIDGDFSKISAEQRVLGAIETNARVEVKNKTLFRYILFRSPQSDVILKIILGAWEHHPEHTDAFVAFLESYQRDESIVKLASKLLESNYPYDYVQGELWKLVARMGKNSELNRLIQLAIATVRNPNTGHASKFGVYVFLCQCDKRGLGNFQKWLYENSPIVQALTAPYVNLDPAGDKRIVQFMLSRTTVDSYLGLVKPFLEANSSVEDFGKDPAKFPVVAQNVFKSAGLSGHEIPRPDAIANLISKRYSVKKWNKWNELLQEEYDHAFKQLRRADSFFESHLSTWLLNQDGFNDIVFRCLQEFLARKGAPGAISLVDAKGVRLDYGVLLDKPAFKLAYPDLYDDLLKVHKRRSSVPEAHPYDKRTGEKARPLTSSEKRMLKLYLDDAFNQIIKITERLGI